MNGQSCIDCIRECQGTDYDPTIPIGKYGYINCDYCRQFDQTHPKNAVPHEVAPAMPYQAYVTQTRAMINDLQKRLNKHIDMTRPKKKKDVI